MSGGPFQFQQQYLLITHPSRAAKYRFDGGVDRFDDAEPYGMIAVGCDAFNMAEEELAQAVHFRQALGGMLRFVTGFLHALPPGVRVEGERVFVDIRAVLATHGLASLLNYVEDIRVSTEDGRLVVCFKAGVRTASTPDR